MKKSILGKMMTMAAMVLLAAGCHDYDGESANGGLYLLDAVTAGGGDGLMPPLPSADQFSEFEDNPFVSTADQPVSTFSVDADGASYAIVRRYLTSGFTVSPYSVRIEELLNYFTFDYAAPTGGEALAVNMEVGTCPWESSHLLLRLGLKGRELAADQVPQANFVFLVDVSGSMATKDKLDLLKAGLKELLHQLRPTDRISLVTYSGEVQKVLESTPVKDISKIERAIDRLNAYGSTAGGEALKMAYEEALANYDPAANNRVIMGTDGDFNVGVTNTDTLVKMVEGYARRGIYMTCLGFGAGNLNDAMMEKLSNKGNGTYHYIDSEQEMMRVFVDERSQFVTVANDVKCQLTFDSTLVSQYRLIGYENRVMDNEDFDDDRKDAAEVGAGQTVTALYELVPQPRMWYKDLADAPIATFDCRYKKSLADSSRLLSLQVPRHAIWEKASSEFNFAAGVAAFGMLLRKSPYKGEATFAMARKLVESALGTDVHGYRAELLQLIDKAAETSM